MTTRVVTVGADELEALVHRACTKAVVDASRQAAASIDRVSAVQAARILRRRKGFLLDACAKGWLPAVRDGKGWKITVADLDAWAKAGCPGTAGNPPHKGSGR